MRYQETAIHIYEAPARAWPIRGAELRGLMFSMLGFMVFVAVFTFVAFGDGAA